MADNIRLSKVLRELNISIDRAIDFLEDKKIEIEKRSVFIFFFSFVLLYFHL